MARGAARASAPICGATAAIRTAFHAELARQGEHEGLTYRVWGSQQPETGQDEIVGYIEASP